MIVFNNRVNNPGVTSLVVGDRCVLLTKALEVAEDELMGKYASLWPLTKVLDIGGTARKPKYLNNGTESKSTTDLYSYK